MKDSRLELLLGVLLVLLPGAVTDDKHQPSLKRKGRPGEFECHVVRETPSRVDSNTCQELADGWSMTIDTFFKFNPQLDRECKTIKPSSDYCAGGRTVPILTVDGSCGPHHNNATCFRFLGQCCNSETWKCGDSKDDCRPGTCYSGACAGATLYAIDGKCGPKHDSRRCGGKWGDCCNYDGVCGTGDNFCGHGNCESGNCTRHFEALGWPEIENRLPWQAGSPTPDGRCGWPEGFTCDAFFGNCCSKDGKCGSHPEHCGEGCQIEFGKCDVMKPASSVVNATSVQIAGQSKVSVPATLQSTVSTSGARRAADMFLLRCWAALKP